MKIAMVIKCSELDSLAWHLFSRSNLFFFACIGVP